MIKSHTYNRKISPESVLYPAASVSVDKSLLSGNDQLDKVVKHIVETLVNGIVQSEFKTDRIFKCKVKDNGRLSDETLLLNRNSVEYELWEVVDGTDKGMFNAQHNEIMICGKISDK